MLGNLILWAFSGHHQLRKLRRTSHTNQERVRSLRASRSVRGDHGLQPRRMTTSSGCRASQLHFVARIAGNGGVQSSSSLSAQLERRRGGAAWEIIHAAIFSLAQRPTSAVSLPIGKHRRRQMSRAFGEEKPIEISLVLSCTHVVSSVMDVRSKCGKCWACLPQSQTSAAALGSACR